MSAKEDKQLNSQIEHAFFLKAVGGWEMREEKTITEDDGKGGQREKHEVNVRQAPPDLEAIRCWLSERAPKRWRGENGARAIGARAIRVLTRVPRPGETAAKD